MKKNPKNSDDKQGKKGEEKSPFFLSNSSIFEGTPISFESDVNIIYGWLEGESTLISSWVRPISLSMFRWQNISQYSSWQKRHTRLKITKGYGVELFFMNNYVKSLIKRVIPQNTLILRLRLRNENKYWNALDKGKL